MRKSLSNIISQFRTFATSHYEIKSFQIKPLDKPLADNNLYPMMHIDIANLKITPEPGQVKITFPTYFLDICNINNENDLISKMSTTLLMCLDFHTYFNTNEDAFGFYMENVNDISPVITGTEDLCIGQNINVTVKVRYDRNELTIPI